MIVTIPLPLELPEELQKMKPPSQAAVGRAKAGHCTNTKHPPEASATLVPLFQILSVAFLTTAPQKAAWKQNRDLLRGFQARGKLKLSPPYPCSTLFSKLNKGKLLGVEFVSGPIGEGDSEREGMSGRDCR